MTKTTASLVLLVLVVALFLNGYSAAAGVERDNQLEKDEANTEATIGLILYCKKLQKLCLIKPVYCPKYYIKCKHL